MPGHESHFPILNKLGLSDSEALVYELLLESGECEARVLVEKSDLGRGNVYNVLAALQEKGLALAIEGKKTRFRAADPSMLRKMLDAEMRKASRLEAQFEDALPELTSTFNLSTGRPAIQIFEGLDGARKALWDSLDSRTEVLTYVDIAMVLKGPFRDINLDYVKERAKRDVAKRVIVADSPAAHEYFEIIQTPNTKVALVPGFGERHGTVVEIYDDTVSFITLTEGTRISLLVHDPHIYEVHKQQFEYIWSTAKDVREYKAEE